MFFFFQAEDGIRDKLVTGVQTCALPISSRTERCAQRTAPSAPSRDESGPRNNLSLNEAHSRRRTLSPSGESRNTATVCGRSAASATASAPRRTSSTSETPPSRWRSASSGPSDETRSEEHTSELQS